MIKSDKLVMVVDDEPAMCDILQRIIAGDGYKVITASDGKTALKLAEKNKPDVILLDLMLPGIDGREIGRRVRAFSPASRIIYLTARAAPTDPSELRQLRSEAEAFITKPATSKRILSTVSQVLSNTRQ